MVDEPWKWYFAGQWEPGGWIFNAHMLRSAAQALFKLHAEARGEDGEPLVYEHLDFDKPATLLYSYALENAIKACIIKNESLNLNPEAAEKDKQFMTHDLVSLISRAKKTVNPTQLSLLKTASAFAQWAGKYPVAFKIEGDKLPRKNLLLEKQLGRDDSFLPVSFETEHLQELDDLFCRLVKEVE